eukprot:297846-Chlamydomonas_euryale.AAC.22
MGDGGAGAGAVCAGVHNVVPSEPQLLLCDPKHVEPHVQGAAKGGRGSCVVPQPSRQGAEERISKGVRLGASYTGHPVGAGASAAPGIQSVLAHRRISLTALG